jgi:guanine deaminase
MHDLRGKILLGTFFHAPRPDSVEVLADALVAVRMDGQIASVTQPGDAAYAEQVREAGRIGTLHRIPAGHYLIPGLVDLHIHAPQFPQLGTALHVPLEVWLQDHTFPLEARFADADFARRAYGALVAELLGNGTTTALLFASIHEEATRILIDLCLEKGLRALVGKVAMDDPRLCPDFYRDPSPAAALDSTEAIIAYARSHPDNRAGRVLPVVTPRFIPACTDPLLEGLGDLAARCSCHIQTHCSESDWEHGYVLSRAGRSDSEALDSFGLLTRHTVLAHGNFLSAADMDLIAARGAGVAHCPLSNVYFSNAVFPLRRALDKGLRVGLGTDIAGGPSASLLDNCRMAVAASRMLEEGVDAALPPGERRRPGTRIDWRTAFHLATAGGADALDLPVGLFAPGRAFDAILVDTATPAGGIRLDDEADPETILQKIIYTASRANLAAIYVAGRAVSPVPAPQ